MKAPHYMNNGPGYSIIELMVTIAIISLVAAIAIPAYQGYISESVHTAARANADTLRVPLEDFRLENGTYVTGGDPSPKSYTEAQLLTDFGWSPDGDNNAYVYAVTATTTSWDITVQHTSGNWMRCENRMRNCCYTDTAGATLAGCP